MDKYFFSVADNKRIESDGAFSADERSRPQSTLGQKDTVNYQFVKNKTSPLENYTEFLAGTTARFLVDVDYLNPGVFIPLGSTGWTLSSGAEYKKILSSKPDTVTFNDIDASEGTVGALAAGEWGYIDISTEIVVRLADDTDPSTKSDDWVQVLYISETATPLFIEASSDVFNQPNSWLDDDGVTLRDPDITQGEVSFFLNSNTVNFYNRLAAASKKDGFAEIQFFEPSTALFFMKAKFSYTCTNRLLTSGEDPLELVGVDVYTKAESDARYVNQDPESFYSEAVSLSDTDVFFVNTGSSQYIKYLTIKADLSTNFINVDFSTYSSKSSIVNADTFTINDSEDSGNVKEVAISVLSDIYAEKGIDFKYEINLVDADFTAGLYTATSDQLGKQFVVDLTASGTDRTIKLPDATAGTAGKRTGITYKDGAVDLTITTIGGTQNVGQGATSQIFQKSNESITLMDNTTEYILSQDSRIDTAGVDVLAWTDGVTSMLDLEDMNKHYLSSGRLDESDITKNEGAGTVDVAQGEWMLRDANNADATLRPAVVSAASALVIADNSTKYLIADYNGGSPIFSIVDDITTIPCQAQCVYSAISRVNTNIDILDLGGFTSDYMAKMTRAFAVTSWLEYGDGLQIADEGLQTFSVTAGSLYNKPNRYTVPGLDTSVSSTFVYYYQDGVGGWTEQLSSTQINITQWDNGTGTLATGASQKYYNHAVYARVNDPTEFAVLYPQAEYNDLATAQANAGVPASTPAFGDSFSTGRFIGTIITKYNTVAFADILSPFDETLTSQTPTNHNNLSGLQLANTAVTYGHIDDQAQSIYGVKTFNSFSITPNLAPTSDYEVANKKYVDDNIGSASEITGTILTTATLTFTAIDTTSSINAIQVEINITDVTSNFYFRKRFDVNVADDGTTITWSPPWGVSSYASDAFTIAVALNVTDIEVSVTNNTVNTVRYGHKLLDKSEV